VVKMSTIDTLYYQKNCF